MIQPPATLTAAARADWDRLAPQLADNLTEATATLLAALCTSLARWAEAEQRIADGGAIVKSPSGFPIQNPYLAVSHQAMQQARQLSRELGLTPTTRRKASRPAEAMPTDDLDALL